MFFALSKIAWALISPPAFILLLLLAGALFRFSAPRFGGFLIFCGILIFAVIGIFPIGPNLLAGLENRYSQPPEMPVQARGIIILGGVFETDVSAARNIPALNDNVERLLEGVRLQNLITPRPVLVFSGGEGKLFHKGHPETLDAEAFLKNLNIDLNNIVFEDKSRNTWENIKFVKGAVAPQSDEPWILITSAYHMPRAIAIAHSLGWQNIIPWPVDYRTEGRINYLPRDFDVMGNLYASSLVLREYAGTYAYRLSGKISSH